MLHIEDGPWLAETCRSSLCAYTNFYRLVCLCWYHFCMYPNNPQIMVLMIPTHTEIQLNVDSESGSNLLTYIYILYKIRKFYYLPNCTITELNNFSLRNGFNLNLS
jgi:hypothetical protein